MKKQVYDTCLKSRYISPYEVLLGVYEGADGQMPDTYSCYADIVMETLMLKCQPIMEKITGLKLTTGLCLCSESIKKEMFLKDIRIALVVKYPPR